MHKLLRLSVSLLMLSLAVADARAQQDGVLQVNDSIHRFLLRQQTAGRLPGAFLSHQPLSAYEARRYLDSLAAHPDTLNRVDRHLLAHFRGEAPGPGAAWVHQRLSFLYPNGRDVGSAQGDGYAIQINPLLNTSVGSARQTKGEDRPGQVSTWQNLRGARLSGHVGKHIFFEARVEEIQRRPILPDIEGATIPRERNVSFLPGRAGEASSTVYDYTHAMAVVGFRSKFFEIRFGRDRNRWGTGINSLMLSDYASVYDQLQIRTTFWRLQYVNLFTAMEDGFARQGASFPRKYGAFQKLSLNLSSRLQIELFESVIHIPDTTREGRRPGYGVEFLNPLIFLHQAEKEHDKLGSVTVGAGLSWIVRPGIRPYGQLLLTELVVKELFAGDGWWGNKWGYLIGLHLADLALNRVDLRLEYARVRPYTYSHHGSSNYLHYNDVLGHPAGQNMEDLAVFFNYRFTRRLSTALNAAFTRRGRDTETENFGGDPRLSYDTRVSEYGVNLLQGIRQESLLLEAHIDYELLPDLFLEGAVRVESVDDEETGLYRYVEPSLSLRWGLPFRSIRY